MEVKGEVPWKSRFSGPECRVDCSGMGGVVCCCLEKVACLPMDGIEVATTEVGCSDLCLRMVTSADKSVKLWLHCAISCCRRETELRTGEFGAFTS